MVTQALLALAEKEQRIYRINTVVFAQGQVSAHVIEKLTVDFDDKECDVKTHCGRPLSYVQIAEYNARLNALVLYQKIGSRRPVLVHTNRAEYENPMNIGKCQACDYVDSDNDLPAALFRRPADIKRKVLRGSAATGLTVHCYEDSIVERFVLAQPSHERIR